jgi:hypothetical protein
VLEMISTTMKMLIRFFKVNITFQRTVGNMHTWRSGYDVWMKGQTIMSLWKRMCILHDFWCNVPFAYIYAEAMMCRFERVIPQCFDAIRQGVWVFFYEQDALCLFLQSVVLSFLVITSMVSYTVFRTRFLHRIWYCS